MNHRNLGSTGLKVSELGLGCSSIGNSVFNYADENDLLKILDYAFENGINFFDTADNYALGNSEELIGKAFLNKRDRVIISTKVGFLPSTLSITGKKLISVFNGARKIIKPFKKNLKRLSKKNQDFSKQHILQSIEKSLNRLKTDYVDLYLLHNPPSEIIKEGEVFKILDNLKTEGKIRFYGISAAKIEDAILCLSFPAISVLQIEFNLLQAEAASKLFPLLKKKQTGIIVKVPLARGILTEKRKVQTGTYLNNQKIGSEQKIRLGKLETELKKKIFPEAALRFILDHHEVSTVIAGTKSINHLKENLNSLSNPSLSKRELKNIFKLFSPIPGLS